MARCVHSLVALNRLGLMLCLMAAAGCDAGGSTEVPNTLAARLAATRDFGDLGTVLATAGLTERLDGEGEFTVFAPSDAAFDALGDGLVTAVLSPEQRALLQRLLLHHVVPGRLAPEDLADGATLTTLAGTTLHVTRVGPATLVDGVPVDLTATINAGNGVAYEVPSVVLTALSTRERVALSPALNTFRDLAGRTDALAAPDGPVTILAPLDDAFDRLGDLRVPLVGSVPVLRRTLLAHVLPGDLDLLALPAGSTVTTVDGKTLRVEGEGLTRTVGGIRVLTGQKTSDGRVYILRDVVLATLTVGDLVRIVPRATRFYSNVQAYPDILARLNDPEDALTVFAPSATAYNAQLNAGVAAALTVPVNAPLARRVVGALVVEGRYGYDDLTDGRTLQALDGTVHTVLRAPAIPPLILGEQVPTQAYVAENGVLYVMSGFLRPFVDPFDTSLLLGLVRHTEAVRAAGLEAQFRALDGTVFAFPNSVYVSTPGLLSRPDLADVLLDHVTATEYSYDQIFPRNPVPLQLDTLTVTTLLGRERAVISITAPGGEITAWLDEAFSLARVGYAGRSYDGPGQLFTVAAVPPPLPLALPARVTTADRRRVRAARAGGGG